MLPLDTDAVPTTPEQWRDALTQALRRRLVGTPVVRVEGAVPNLSTVDVDLSGCRLEATEPPDLTTVHPYSERLTVNRLRLTAHPLAIRGIPVKVDLEAEAAAFTLGRNAAGRVVVNLANATDGRLAAAVAAADLDAALLLAARAGAPAGVDVRSVHATLVGRGPRDLQVTLDVTAAKVMRFTLRVAGRLSVDDSLTATATGLTVEGSGMAAGFAAAMVRPQLVKLEGQRWPLLPFAPGGVRLRDVAVDVTNGLAVTATFGDGAVA